MGAEILSLFFGLGTGMLTGLFFERRALRMARAQNSELRAELDALRSTLYSLGGSSTDSARADQRDNVSTDVARWAVTSQDPSGRVDRRGLIAHFLQDGCTADEIDAAILSLCDRGTARDDGRWLHML